MSTTNKILLSLCVSLVLVATCITTSSLAARSANTQPDTIAQPNFKTLENAAPTQQAQQGEKVDQTRKNIQVIKGLPDAELVNLMNFVASSLGVRCDHCHVTQGKDPKTGFTNWVWESDDKPAKQTARRMMRMVMSINATNKADFRDNAVTCFTCHREQLAPIGLPQMPLAKSGHEPGPNEAPVVRPATPSVEAILTKYAEAVGGSTAENTKTLILKGKREASQNRIFATEITLVAPHKFLLVTTTPQNVVRQIVNGESGWAVTGRNLRTLGPEDIAESKRSLNELFGVIKVRPSPGFKAAGAARIDDHDVFIIEKVTDAKTERYYFDAQNGLLIRKLTIATTLLVPLPEQIDFLDYREVEGVKVPFTIRLSAIDTFNSWTRTFTEIKRNAPVDDGLFAKPEVAPN
jgi:hypothetical protein